MSHRTAFWILILLTIIAAVLQMFGYNFLEVLVILLIIDSIAFGATIEIEKKKSLKEIEMNDNITLKVEKIEKICQDVLQKVDTNSSSLNLEEKLEKLSRKTLELEQKIKNFGLNLAEHVEDFDNRLEKLEENREI
jgi:hypothetical protein